MLYRALGHLLAARKKVSNRQVSARHATGSLMLSRCQGLLPSPCVTKQKQAPPETRTTAAIAIYSEQARNNHRLPVRLAFKRTKERRTNTPQTVETRASAMHHAHATNSTFGRGGSLSLEQKKSYQYYYCTTLNK